MKNENKFMDSQEECQNKKKKCKNILVITTHKEKNSSNKEKTFQEEVKQLCDKKVLDVFRKL